MSAPSVAPSGGRASVDGKFFRLNGKKLFFKAVTYGPFAPDAQGETFGSQTQVAADFRLIQELGANGIRVYYPPPRWFLNLALEHGLKVLIDIPWPKHLCFLDSEEAQDAARETVRQAVVSAKGHPAVFAFSVVNEIPAEIVRWSGARRVEAFIDELIDLARAEDSSALFTFTSYPPTEFLRSRSADFVCFNVYLHRPKEFEAYLARLQMLADTKPLLLGEFGMDSLREGEAHKGEFLSWQIELGARAGLAGTVVFSFTDDWFRGGLPINDWAFGLTTRDRQVKDSYSAVQRQYRLAPAFPLPRYPKVSVVVASFNGGRTLRACLESLQNLNYPNYEVILVDDGSTDDTQAIARAFPEVRAVRQENRGLSVARNTGIAAATGEIVAFTDSDCRADEDWLRYLVGDLLNSEFIGMGGHNFLPPDDSLVAAAVLVSPGGPAHVMLTDREAEHIPGCNMAFYKASLEEIGGFDPVFRKAGDDVDLCWRLQQRGHRIGFSPAGFVWHYRRSTIQAYLKQQAGYGEAEALLARKHPEYFNGVGNGIWRGRIYSSSRHGVVLQRSIIYHGTFGSAFFQTLYSAAPSFSLMICTSLEYHGLVTLPIVLLSWLFPFLWPLATTSLLLSLGVCAAAAVQAELPATKRRFWSRPLVALLFLLQPLERGWARYRLRFERSPAPRTFDANSPQPPLALDEPEQLSFWSKGDVERYRFLAKLTSRLEGSGFHVRPDSGWSDFDLELSGPFWSRLRLITVTEELELGRRNFHCRLRGQWSLAAKLLFLAGVAAELLVIALLAPFQPWIWMLPLTLPFLALLIGEQSCRLKETVASHLAALAVELKLVRLTNNQTKPAASPSPDRQAPERVLQESTPQKTLSPF
jgi:glycosyltransferase involved in cell wall biosynthesis